MGSNGTTPRSPGLGLACKLAVVVCALGVTALMLLGLRHSRLVAARDLARARIEIRAIDEQVAALRSSIAQRVHPDAIEALLERLDGDFGPFEPIVPETPDAPDSMGPGSDRTRVSMPGSAL